MNLEDEEKFERANEIAKVVRTELLNMLGLNLMPVEDEETGLLRAPEVEECVPLALAIGRDEFVQMVLEKRDEFATQERERRKLELEEAGIVPTYPTEGDFVEMTPEELDEFMKSDSDVEFENTPEEVRKFLDWGSKETQLYLENLVLNKDDIDEGSLDQQPARTLGQARRDLIQELQRERQQDGKLIPVRIESDSILGGIPEKPERSRITVETSE